MKNYIEQKQTYLRDIKSCPKSEQCHYDDDCDGTKSGSKYDSEHGCPDEMALRGPKSEALLIKRT